MRNRQRLGWCVVSAAIALAGCGEGDGGDVDIIDRVPKIGIPCSAEPAPPLRGDRGGLGEISPQFGSPWVQPEVAPPPISGGTLAASSDGTTLIAADPDRDAIYVIDAVTRVLTRRIELQPGDEPGRVVEDKTGKFHVSLRGGAALVSFGRGVNDAVKRTKVCSLPRGLAYDAARDRLYVACAEGRLVEVDPNAAIATRKIELGRDLRDVIVRGSSVVVSRFRSAELVEVNLADGSLMGSRKPATVQRFEQAVVEDDIQPLGDAACNPTFTHVEARTNELEAEVAWRTIDVPGAGIAMLHQRAGDSEVQVLRGGYGSSTGCSSGIVRPALTIGDGVSNSVELAVSGLLVDLAADPTGELLAVANPGGWGTSTSVMLFRIPQVSSVTSASASSTECHTQVANVSVPGQATAVSFVTPWMLAVQEREPAAISFYDVRTQTVLVRLDLQQPSRADTGHTLFHLATSAGIACASCHAEAGDDGHVWSFHGIGPRRTQNLRGGILGSEPFHWNGDMRDFSMLVDEVFVGRMGAPETAIAKAFTLAEWIDRQPALHAEPDDMEAVARGKALFESEAVGCAQCHNGARLSNNETRDVGTGALLQVPSLRSISFRAPFMHDGCAPTLIDRFAACGGGDNHGRTSQLSPNQLGDVVAYLESL